MGREHFLDRLRSDTEGAMIIETALIAPVLVLMSLGAYQVSGMVARQSELQSAAAEASAIALAAKPDTDAKLATVKQIVMASTGLSAEKVTIEARVRCGTSINYVTTLDSCGTERPSRYVKIYLSDTYQPAWTQFGVGSPLNYNVTRYVMISQDGD